MATLRKKRFVAICLNIVYFRFLSILLWVTASYIRFVRCFCNGYKSLFQWLVGAMTPSVGIATFSSLQSGRLGNVDNGSLFVVRQRYTNQCLTFPAREQHLISLKLTLNLLSDLL